MNFFKKRISLIYSKLLNFQWLFTFNIDQYQAVRCYVCDYCPVVTSESITKHNNCTSCVMGGSHFEIHRICLFDTKIPINFPQENREECRTDLCNGKTVDNTARK
ncbi:uncharacterized protein DC041_0012074 [Schistosoma bovis]|uniref:Uncharacterized protein n=1 Tax=Schistosoma bovis TaxID=6184 RepID=A0A430QF55_SCHBO|nr:uncharacterized protein DC041_0012074 [Schistosoma bovis]